MSKPSPATHATPNAPHMPSDFIDLAARRPVYDPASKIPVQGLLLGWIELPTKAANAGTREPWTAYVIRLTAPCSAVTREGNEDIKVDLEAGEEMLVTRTSTLKNKLDGAAESERFVFEIYLAEPEKRPNTTGGEYWLYGKMGVSRKSIQRAAEHMVALPKAPPKSLQGASALDTAEVPFS